MLSLLVNKISGQTNDSFIPHKGEGGLEWKGKTLNGRRVGMWQHFKRYSEDVLGEYFYNSIDSNVVFRNYDNGKVLSIEYMYYLNDSTFIPHGFFQSYSFMDYKHVLSEGTNYLGKLHGKLRRYDPYSFNLVLIANYRNGVEVDSHFVFYEDGSIKEAGFYDNYGNRICVWKEYYKNGSLEAEGRYLPNHENMVVETENNEVKIKTHKKNFVKNGVWTYYSTSGSVIKVEKYSGGKLAKVITGKSLRKSNAESQKE